jgi:hypothetical protein
VNDFKISKSQVAFFKEMYRLAPMQVKEQLEAMKAQDFLKNEIGLSGDGAPPADPQTEFSVKVAEKMANDKTLKQGDAVRLVQKENPALSEKVFKAQMKTEKGGEE